MTRKEVLDAAALCVMTDRNADYGEPEDNFANIADLWGAFTGHEFTPAQVAVMCALIKISRMRTSPNHPDHYVDLAGYAACAAECAT